MPHYKQFTLELMPQMVFYVHIQKPNIYQNYKFLKHC